MANGINKLSKFTGIPPNEIRSIAEKVRANSVRLNNCPGPHNFIETTKHGKFPTQWKCTICEGTANSINKFWYDRGLNDGYRLFEKDNAKSFSKNDGSKEGS